MTDNNKTQQIEGTQKEDCYSAFESTNLLCPDCCGTDFETWKELEYENSDDPTPEYGGALTSVTFHECKNIDCRCVF